MKIRKPKTRSVFLRIAVILFLFCGCTENGETDTQNGKSDAGISGETEMEGSLPEAFSYVFDPHVISEEYVLIYGKSIKEEFFTLCDAVRNGETGFPCVSKERFHQLMSIADSCFPLAGELIDKEQTRIENGICYLQYRYDEKETKEKTVSFIHKVSTLIKETVLYEEPDHLKAMELFTAVARKDTYDDSYTLEDSLKLRPYRAIMEEIGICQEITGEYIYYLLQVGIDAIPCSSLNRDQSEAHEWALVKLDGKYYHMDPTYATQYPDSLFFFGMDDIQREYYGDLPAGQYTYAGSDLLDGETYAAADRRFEPFWLAKEYEIDPIHKKIIITELNTDKKYEYDF